MSGKHSITNREICGMLAGNPLDRYQMTRGEMVAAMDNQRRDYPKGRHAKVSK